MIDTRTRNETLDSNQRTLRPSSPHWYNRARGLDWAHGASPAETPAPSRRGPPLRRARVGAILGSQVDLPNQLSIQVLGMYGGGALISCMRSDLGYIMLKRMVAVLHWSI